MEKFLPEICTIQYGFPFDSAKFSTSEGMPLIRIRDVVRGYSETFTTEEYKKEYVVNKDDLLIGMDGEFNIAKWGETPALLNQRVCRLIPTPEVDKNYLFYFMPNALKRIEEKTPFVTVKHLSAKELNKVKVPLPPLEEQRRIAAVLDKVSELIAKRQAQLDKLDLLVKARFVEMFGDPILNSLEWPIKKLNDLSQLITNGNTPKGGSENYVSDGILFLRSQNVWRNRIDFDDVAFIDEATHASMAKSSLHDKDILITKTGRINTENSSLGRAALFRGEDNSANINGHVYLVRLNDTVVPEYVVAILTGEPYRKYIRKVCVGGIDKRQINLDQVEDFPIILPPYEMQEQFAAFVGQTDKSKLTIQQSLDKLEMLKKALMQQYFG